MAEITVNSAKHDVFEIFTDLENWSECQQSVTKARINGKTEIGNGLI